VQLYRGPQSDQEVIAYRTDVWVAHLVVMILICGRAIRTSQGASRGCRV
jgi:hypothetical protein